MHRIECVLDNAWVTKFRPQWVAPDGSRGPAPFGPDAFGAEVSEVGMIAMPGIGGTFSIWSPDERRYVVFAHYSGPSDPVSLDDSFVVEFRPDKKTQSKLRRMVRTFLLWDAKNQKKEEKERRDRAARNRQFTYLW